MELWSGSDLGEPQNVNKEKQTFGLKRDDFFNRPLVAWWSKGTEDDLALLMRG